MNLAERTCSYLHGLQVSSQRTHVLLKNTLHVACEHDTSAEPCLYGLTVCKDIMQQKEATPQLRQVLASCHCSNLLHLRPYHNGALPSLRNSCCQVSQAGIPQDTRIVLSEQCLLILEQKRATLLSQQRTVAWTKRTPCSSSCLLQQFLKLLCLHAA